MKILIVDDEPLVRKSLGRACRAKGHEVTEAADGTEGLLRWQEIKPDLVFLDVLMPGLSGPELLKAIRSRDQSDDVCRAQVIMMSAYSGEHNVATADSSEAFSESNSRPMGADLFIPKPFDDIFALVAKAEELFGRSSDQSQKS